MKIKELFKNLPDKIVGMMTNEMEESSAKWTTISFVGDKMYYSFVETGANAAGGTPLLKKEPVVGVYSPDSKHINEFKFYEMECDEVLEVRHCIIKGIIANTYLIVNESVLAKRL